jgi:hypothetical protein
MAPLARALTAATLALLTANAIRAQVPTPDSLQTLLKTTTFAFQGTVQKQRAVADPVLTASSRTIVVRTTDVLQCPSDVGDYTGETVTVLTPSDTLPPIGTSVWFFATAWVIGDRIAVDAAATFPKLTPIQSQQLAANFDEAVWRGYLSLLLARVASSSLVAIGTVTGVQSVHRQATRTGEHVIPWLSLGVHLDSIIRGNKALRAQPTQILVPQGVVLADTGMTVAPGDRKLFLVQSTGGNVDFAELDTRAPFFARDSLGIRPLAEVPQVMTFGAMTIVRRLPLARCKTVRK